MCCVFLALLILGPRIFGLFWWLFQPERWQLSFNSWSDLWWFWPVLGILFLPWTTLMYVFVAPDGVKGWDSLWIGLMLLVDIATYATGVRRKLILGYEWY